MHSNHLTHDSHHSLEALCLPDSPDITVCDEVSQAFPLCVGMHNQILKVTKAWG